MYDLEKRIFRLEIITCFFGGVLCVMLPIIAGMINHNIDDKFKAFENKIDLQFELIQTQINSKFKEQNLKLDAIDKEIKSTPLKKK